MSGMNLSWYVNKCIVQIVSDQIINDKQIKLDKEMPSFSRGKNINILKREKVQQMEYFDDDLIRCHFNMENLQPNKDHYYTSKTVVTCDIHKKIISIFYKYTNKSSPREIAERIANKFSLTEYDIKCVDIELVVIAENIIIRSDILSLIVQLCLHEEYHVADGNLACQRRYTKLVDIDNKIVLTVRNARLVSLSMMKMLNMKYLTQYCEIKLLSVSDEMIATVMYDRVASLLNKYNDLYDNMSEMIDKVITPNPEYSSVKEENPSDMKLLRSQLPELFIQRYSREAPKMPRIVTEQEARELIDDGYSVLKYPEDGAFSRYYASPSRDLYVGLKVNRMPNSDAFPYIIACYATDHSTIPGTKTYEYLTGGDSLQSSHHGTYHEVKIKKLQPDAHGIVPLYISNMLNGKERERYRRRGLPLLPQSFVRSLRGKGSTHYIVSKQEMYDKTIEEIKDLWENCISYDSLLTMYRILENIIEADIVVINDSSHEAEVEIPNHVGYYIWKPSYNKMLLISHTRINEYETVYELIVPRVGSTFIDYNTDIYKKIINIKLQQCYKPISDILSTEIEEIRDIRHQYVNYEGKCVLIEGKDGAVIDCYSRPLCCNHTLLCHYDKVCKFNSYETYNTWYNHKTQDKYCTIGNKTYYVSEELDKGYIPRILEGENIKVIENMDEIDCIDNIYKMYTENNTYIYFYACCEKQNF